MNPSKVYYTDLHVHGNTNLLRKLEKLIRAAGIENIDFANRFTALKLHFGEEGNLAYLRPNYVKVVADVVKSLGGVPFLTDCNTLYVGSRKNAIDHLDVAALHGFGSSIFHTGIWDLPLIFVKKCAKSGIFYRSCPIEIPWGFWYTFVVIWCVPFATRPLWMFPHPQGAFFARFVTCAHSFLWFA